MIPETDRRRDDMRAVVLVPVLKNARASRAAQPEAAPVPQRSEGARLEEAIGLARAFAGAVIFALP